MLKDTQDFQLNTRISYLKALKPSDKKVLLALKASGLRGMKLIKKTYQENPHFTRRSEILEKIFTPKEITQLQFAWNTDKKPVIFTLGYEGLTIDAFLYKLIVNNVMAVIDVRNNPQSIKFGFSKKSLSSYIEKAEMEYFHIPELGIPSAMRKGLDEKISYKRLFNKYETSLLPHQKEAKNQLLKLIEKYQRIALVCFEADHNLCHRHTLVKSLQKERALIKPVIHLF